MRIISDFRDFYDITQATGQDQSLVYLRTPKILEISNYPFPYFSPGWSCNFGFGVINHIIGFCGKIYPFLELSYGIYSKKYCYKLKDVDDFVDTNCKEKEKNFYFKKNKHKGKHFLYDWPSNQKRTNFEQFFEKFKNITVENLFVENYSPLFHIQKTPNLREKNKIEFNACLKPYEFMRIFDPYSAFQEISMYLGGIAVPQKEIPFIDDKTLAESKGFDKWSFRKCSG